MMIFIVLSSEVIARVHSVHLVNVEQRQAAADPQTKPPDLGCESACFRQLSSTTTITIYYYYSARKQILIYHPTEGRRLELTSTLQERCTQPVPKAVNHSGCVINTTAHSAIQSQDLAHCSQACYC